MKPFNLEEAKAGKPVCTRDGRKVEILRFDLNSKFPILGIVEMDGQDTPIQWNEKGKITDNYLIGAEFSDLMMASEKHEGWINIIKKSSELSGYDLDGIYISENDAKEEGEREDNYITTIHVEWEE